VRPYIWHNTGHALHSILFDAIRSLRGAAFSSTVGPGVEAVSPSTLSAPKSTFVCSVMLGFPYDDITIGPARLMNSPCLKGLSLDPHFSVLRSLTVRVVSATPNLLEIYSIKIDCATSFPADI
jgi:hypothetical protein